MSAVLTKQEQDEFKQLISDTKGLSQSGKQARLTIIAGLPEVKYLIQTSNKKGLSLGQTALWIIQQHIGKNPIKEKK